MSAPTKAARQRSSEALALVASPSSTRISRQEARRRLAAGESCREVAKTYRVHHSTVARLV